MASPHDRFPPRDNAAYRRILAAAETRFETFGFQKSTVAEPPDAQRWALDAFETLLFGICQPRTEPHPPSSQRRKRSK